MITFATPAGPTGTQRRTTDAARWLVHVVLATQIAVVGAGRVPECCGALSDHLSAVGGNLWLQVTSGTVEPAGVFGLAVPCVLAVAALGLLGVVVVVSLAHLVGLLVWARRPYGRSR
jgi:hypothetical protein